MRCSGRMLAGKPGCSGTRAGHAGSSQSTPLQYPGKRTLARAFVIRADTLACLVAHYICWIASVSLCGLLSCLVMVGKGRAQEGLVTETRCCLFCHSGQLLDFFLRFNPGFFSGLNLFGKGGLFFERVRQIRVCRYARGRISDLAKLRCLLM